jgi:hypothetical protein
VWFNATPKLPQEEYFGIHYLDVKKNPFLTPCPERQTDSLSNSATHIQLPQSKDRSPSNENR